jgi:hypothetical protein
MTFFVLASVLILTAVLAPWFGVDSRGLTDRPGGPPDVLPEPPERHRRPVATPPARTSHPSARPGTGPVATR